MPVSTPCYCSREDVKSALDFKESARINAQIDRALMSAARNIDGHLHRHFHPKDQRKFFDWPNYSYAYPWRIWFDQHDLIAATLVQSPFGATIPLNEVFAEPVNTGPPYTSLELDRSTVAAWGAGPTPQHSIVVTGTWGYSANADPAGTLAAAVSSTSATTITVTDGSQIGAGDLLILDYAVGAAPYPTAYGTAGAIGPITGERVLVAERATATTGQTNVSGATTASAADDAVTVTDGTQINVGEVLLLDSERLLVVDITGNVLTVKRAWDGTVLTAHSTATTLYAYRSLTVVRGQLGTLAATHSSGAAVYKHRPPSLIRDLAIAETLNRVLQETSGMAITVGEGDNAHAGSGAGLVDMWDEALTVYGRKNRKRVI